MTDDNKTTPTTAPGLDLDAVEAAERAMTLGPWEMRRESWFVQIRAAADLEELATTEQARGVDVANAAGIVALKNAAPALIAEVRALRAKLAEAKRLGREAYDIAASAVQVIDDEGIDDDNESPRVKRDLGRIAAALEAL